MAANTHRLRCEFLEQRRLTAADVVEGLNISVASDGLAGLRAAEIRLNYDPRALSLSEHDIQVGQAWEGTAGLVSKVDEDAGSVNIFLFSAEPITADVGALVAVKFQVLDSLAADVASATLSRFQLNEGEIESSPQLTPVEIDSSINIKSLVDDRATTQTIHPDPSPTSTPEHISHPLSAEELEIGSSASAPEVADRGRKSVSPEPYTETEPSIHLEELAAGESQPTKLIGSCPAWNDQSTVDVSWAEYHSHRDVGPALPTAWSLESNEPLVADNSHAIAAPPVELKKGLAI